MPNVETISGIVSSDDFYFCFALSFAFFCLVFVWFYCWALGMLVLLFFTACMLGLDRWLVSPSSSSPVSKPYHLP